MNTAFASTPTAAVVLADSDPRSPANIERRQALRIAERDELGRLLPGSILERAGRPTGHSVQFMARQYTAEAIACLAGVMDDEKAPQAARVTAAQALLDRGWGKAPIQIDLNVRAKFDDFLRDIGIEAAYERDHPVVAEAEGTDE
jgi:hypothetical protein